MTDRSRLLASIAETVADYRAGELPVPSPEHVDRWVCQFLTEVQVPLLRELDHVLRSTYLSKASVEDFLDEVIEEEKLTGDDPRSFWMRTNFLEIQNNGTSQSEMLEIFERRLNKHCGIALEDCGSTSGAFVYLDDVMFTGHRVQTDLQRWVTEDAPAVAVVHVVVTVIHTGTWFARDRIKDAIADSEKKISVKYWRKSEVENRKAYRNRSGVLWPVSLPDDSAVNAYADAQEYPHTPRSPPGDLGPFSSEEGRQLLEREFLVAGVTIRSAYENLSDSLRPLGFSGFGLGFGSMIVTFRNCPNNAPLALWWGNLDAQGPASFDNWYPLFARKTYGDDGDFDVLIV